MKNKITDSIRGLHYYFSQGSSFRIPYFKTIGALVFAVYLHFLQIGIALNRFANINVDIFPVPEDVHRGVKYIFLGLYFALIYFVLTKFFPRSVISDNSLSSDVLRKHRYYFFIYLGVNVLLLVLLISDKIIIKK